MQAQNKIKLFIILAIILIILLFVISVVQIVNIKNKQNLIAEQQKEISRLEEELNYWENKNENDTSIDNDVVIEGEIWLL